ncbi:hypothetical protein EKE94_01345 [Mesobaculum littorinae]|uniref:Uncharacterized protein n=1 Tax=Mesobaculum littorinae TaxID=2486419 RepID=A0A438ALE3_9RHOB|nr:hypothetical protein [Mesobaculum littorinae]RVV99366.1 hypothetical protein EKE94_01345 [Mesobaculum littorinae]
MNAIDGAMWLAYGLLRDRVGRLGEAICDDAGTAASVGVDTARVTRLSVPVSAFGCAVAGALWLAGSITYQPHTVFGVQWSVFMLFMVLVGRLGSDLRPLVRAVLFYPLKESI